MQSPALVIAAHASRIPPRSERVDFQVVRSHETLWTIRALSDRGKNAAAQYFPLISESWDDDSVVVNHMMSNELLYRLRLQGFSILYLGPAGPVEI